MRDDKRWVPASHGAVCNVQWPETGLRYRRAVVVIGDEKGRVGVGTSSAKEVVDAVQKAVADAKKHLITVPLTRSLSFPHKFNGIFGAAKVMLRPASEGTGVIAGA